MSRVDVTFSGTSRHWPMESRFEGSGTYEIEGHLPKAGGPDFYASERGGPTL